MALFLKTFFQKEIFWTIVKVINFLKLKNTQLHDNHSMKASKEQMNDLHDPATNKKWGC